MAHELSGSTAQADVFLYL